MRFAILLILTILLNGCGSKTPLEQAHDSLASNLHSTELAVVAVEKQLPEECRTEAIKYQFEAIRTHINSIEKEAGSLVGFCDSALEEKDNRIRELWCIIILLIAGVAGAILAKLYKKLP